MSQHRRCPVGHTCSDIDSVISELEAIESDIGTALKCLEDASKRVSDLYGHRRSLLESLRSDNAALRDWGSQEADRVDALEDEAAS